MFGQTFYHSTIKNYVNVFGNLFNDIHIERKDNTQTVIQTIKVPIAYGPKQKWYVRITQDPQAGSDTQTPVQVIVPRMGFELTTLTYAPERKLQSINRNVQIKTLDNANLITQFNPVAYDFHFELSLFTRNMDDTLAIIEQICPYFTPDFSLSVKDIPDLLLNRDIQILMKSIAVENAYEGKFDERQPILSTMEFMLKGYLYPQTVNKPIILTAITDLLSFENSSHPGGLRVSTTINPPTADADDDFTFTTTLTDLKP